MTTRATSGPQIDPPDSAPGAADMLLVAMPLDTYRALSDAAAKRNMTFAAAISEALNAWLGSPAKPQLLVEQKENHQ